MSEPIPVNETGAQRLSIGQLKQWEALKFGIYYEEQYHGHV